MRRYHLVIVTALVGAIAACLMIRTPDASASSESVTYIRPQAEERPSLMVAQTEAPDAEAAPAVEEAAPSNDPVLNEALAQEQEPAASPKEQKPMKESFAQSPKTSRKAAGVKSKKSSKSKAKKTAKHPKKKKKKAKKA
jgi:hypothetical protein